MARGSRWLIALAGLGLLGLGAAGAGAVFLQQQGITPRALAPYVAKRSSGHNSVIVGAGQRAAAMLTVLDRGHASGAPLQFGVIGAQQSPVASAATIGTPRLVATSAQARKAIAEAQPGDVITFIPGVYRFDGAAISANRGGTDQANIVVRAEHPGTVKLEFNLAEGFVVSAPYWRFENLDIRGACRAHASCEHAFHVVGAASHFKAFNNTVTDFNAHFKINGLHGRFPDHGRIEGNTLRNESVRDTASAVTPIDLVAGSHWKIRRNLISDFLKGGGDRISYGAYVKGAGMQNVIEQNVVVCEARLHGLGGQRVGLSLGGGGTGKPYCRDKRCIAEQEQSEIRANLVASCSDDGIYLNNAAASKIIHNTLIDTGGIQVRFPASTADIEGNLVDGDIRGRNGAELRLVDNRTTPIAQLYAGYHPVRGLFRDTASFDFAWAADAPRRSAARQFIPDLCGVQRGTQRTYGAFEDISRCTGQKD